MVTERIPTKFGLDPFRDVQVLTPQVKTVLGVANLNRELQAALNPGGPAVAEVKRFDTTFRAGDKVMQMQNNYDREVFNGDIGRVRGHRRRRSGGRRSISTAARSITTSATSTSCNWPTPARSTKRRGAEYPAVVIPVHTQHYMMLQRNLLYTGDHARAGSWSCSSAAARRCGGR